MHVFELSLSWEALVPLFVSEHLGELVSFRSSLSLSACSARREGRETVKQLAAVSVCCSVRRALQDPAWPNLPLHPLAQRQRWRGGRHQLEYRPRFHLWGRLTQVNAPVRGPRRGGSAGPTSGGAIPSCHPGGWACTRCTRSYCASRLEHVPHSSTAGQSQCSHHPKSRTFFCWNLQSRVNVSSLECVHILSGSFYIWIFKPQPRHWKIDLLHVWSLIILSFPVKNLQVLVCWDWGVELLDSHSLILHEAQQHCPQNWKTPVWFFWQYIRQYFLHTHWFKPFS